jgi:hypothetical protein
LGHAFLRPYGGHEAYAPCAKAEQPVDLGLLDRLRRGGGDSADNLRARRYIAMLDSLLNHASSATRGGGIGTYQRALLIEPTRRVMPLWDGLLRNAVGLSPAETAEPQLVPGRSLHPDRQLPGQSPYSQLV